QFGPMRITSGFRCPNHPEERKKKRGGAHSIGHAADISYSNGSQLYILISQAPRVGMKGIGTGKSFVHLDDKHPYLDRGNGVAWTY
ncbi:D-Ala-D-Ala carboxypeptidase family metallohydrolase, partial [Kiloniella antarctica]